MAGSDTVSFRIPSDTYDSLAKKARRSGLSVGELCRAIVLESLEMDEQPGTMEEVQEARRDIRAIREDLAVSVEAILVSTGTPPEKARAFADRNLREMG